jgi:hypothetical protein
MRDDMRCSSSLEGTVRTWRHAMDTRKSGHWILSLALMSTALVWSTLPAYPQTAGSSGSGSVGSSSRESMETSRSATPRSNHQLPSTSPSGRFNQMQKQRQSERTQALEERLQNGQIDKPVAQGQISERLEQFYRSSAEK